MRPDDYPPQEPFSELARRYHDAVMARGSGIVADHEALFGRDPYQSLAIQRAARPSGDVLVLWHGGGWTNGYKEWLAFMAPALTAAGVIVVLAGYRLAPGHVFPAALDDAVAAVAWVHGHIGEHGGRADRLFLGGHSAGGHYASLLAVRRDWQGHAGVPQGVVRGCLPISGVYRFGEGSGLTMRPRFLGPEGTEGAASPILNIQGTPPPFLMAHGDRDFPHLMVQAVEMAAALRKAGTDATRVVLASCDHFEASYVSGDPAGPWLPRAVAWMREH
jgi:acetyl esterase/lipase